MSVQGETRQTDDIRSLLSEIHAAEQHRRRHLEELRRFCSENDVAMCEGGATEDLMQSSSAGIGIGKVYVPTRNVSFEDISEQATTEVDTELRAFNRARKSAVTELKDLSEGIRHAVPKSDLMILQAHVQMVEDPKLAGRVREIIKEGYTAAWALKQAITEFSSLFARMDDPYLRERADDVVDVGLRILRNLLRKPSDSQAVLEDDFVLMAESLPPSVLMSVPRDRLKGLVLGNASQTSHIVILARSFAIPVITGAVGLVRQSVDGQMCIVDGDSTRIFLNPGDELIQRYRYLQETDQWLESVLEKLAQVPAVTTDNIRIKLFANAGPLDDFNLVETYGAGGVGLYRSELHFLGAKRFPSEEEQEELYRTIAEKMNGRVVTVRTLDIGGDKFLPYLEAPHEANPFLGWRAIRASLDMPEVFRTQLSAILKGSGHNKAQFRIMLPMVTNIEEVERTRYILKDILETFDKDGTPYAEDIKLGVMIETPAAVRLAPVLARHVDFFSIGSNDLIQFTLAVDRTNNRVAPLYDMFHPAVLMAINDTVTAAREAGIDCSLCGEAAANPLIVPALIGLGLDTLSMNPTSLHHIKRVILACNHAQCIELARELLTLESGHQIRLRLVDYLMDIGVLFGRARRA